LWLYAIVGAFLMLALVVGVPAWASSTPSDLQQGTVPPPPVGDDTGGGNEDDDDDQPVATATPAAPGGAAAGQPAALVPVGTPSTYTGTVTAERLNVRSGPATTFPSVGRLFEGEVVTILFRNEVGDWWYTCCISGTTTSGWVSSLFVEPGFDSAQALTLIPVAGEQEADASPAAAATPGPDSASVSAARLNVRAAPELSAPIIGRLTSGSVVTVTARNRAGDWWYVCCLPSSETAGWVSSRFLAPGFPRVQANRLLPVLAATAASTSTAQLPTPTPSPAAGADATATTSLTETETSTASLSIVASQAPTLAVQGEPVELRFTISNIGGTAAAAVELRNQLPAGLTLGMGDASGGARFTTARTPEGAEVFAFLWPEIGAGEVITAAVQITVSEALTNGLVLENLASLSAANVAAQTVAVNVGLPPAGLPDFR
jgi:uncharacterized repeat protein (TIGR01451 family)